MSEQPTVDYRPDPLPGGKVPTKWLSVTLVSGAEVRVGVQADHPHGGIGIVHEIQCTQPDGRRTRLRFSLTPEAAVALVLMYATHGILDVPMHGEHTRDFEARITPHILRNWPRARIVRFAKHLLGDVCQACPEHSGKDDTPCSLPWACDECGRVMRETKHMHICTACGKRERKGAR